MLRTLDTEAMNSMESLARNWWLIVLRGICAILFGVMAFAWPGVTLSVLVLLFGAYAFADGMLAFAAAFSGTGVTPWWVLMLEGVAGVGAAAIAFFAPGLTVFALLYVIAAWAIVTGVFEIAAAIQLRKEIAGEIWLALAGLASLGFGLLLLGRPGTGIVAIVWMIGGYAFVFGVLLVALGLRVRALRALPF